MENPVDHLLKFVRLFSAHPDEIEVIQVNGNPNVFEVRMQNGDAKELREYLEVLQAIVVCSTGMSREQFELRILENGSVIT